MTNRKEMARAFRSGHTGAAAEVIALAIERGFVTWNAAADTLELTDTGSARAQARKLVQPAQGHA